VDTLPDSPSTACIIEWDGAPIGFIQFYLWSSYADGAEEVGIPFDDRTYSLDVFIGDPEVAGRGVGTRVVDLLSNHILGKLGGSAVSLTTDVDNHQAQRCYVRAGFKKIEQVLDSDTYQGERAMSWLMVKDSPKV
jgi:aminoglycoside 6'-N-acetyltransferase